MTNLLISVKGRRHNHLFRLSITECVMSEESQIDEAATKLFLFRSIGLYTRHRHDANPLIFFQREQIERQRNIDRALFKLASGNLSCQVGQSVLQFLERG